MNFTPSGKVGSLPGISIFFLNSYFSSVTVRDSTGPAPTHTHMNGVGLKKMICESHIYLSEGQYFSLLSPPKGSSSQFTSSRLLSLAYVRLPNVIRVRLPPPLLSSQSFLILLFCIVLQSPPSCSCLSSLIPNNFSNSQSHVTTLPSNFSLCYLSSQLYVW